MTLDWLDSALDRRGGNSVCVCVRVCVRACVRACVCIHLMRVSERSGLFHCGALKYFCALTIYVPAYHGQISYLA